MSIKINNQDIVAIYKGGQSIVYVYKGTDLVWRLVELGMDDDIFFVDPEVGRVLHANGLIKSPIKSSRRELATITSLNPDGYNNTGYFYNNEVVKRFPELKYCTGLTSLRSAFEGCSSLTEVILPSSVTSLRYTFYGCSSLTTAPNIPKGVTDMTYTFSHCSSLTTAPVIPYGVTNMFYTFYRCSSLTEAPIIPESVTDMRATFFGCSSLLEAPDIPSNVTDLRNTFRDCSNLDGIFVIKPVNPPHYGAFQGVNVIAIYVPDESINTYKNDILSLWPNYSYIMYPMSDYDIFFADREVGRVLKSKGLIADPIKSSKRELATITSLNPNGGSNTGYFYNNKVVKRFPELKYCTGLSDLRYTFRNCSNLKEVGNIPDSVTDMTYTFSGCSNLINAPIISISVTDMIGTFKNCYRLLEAPIIPESVTDMSQTFYGCSNLDGIFVIKPVIPPTYSDIFLNVNVVRIYVPDESVDSYKTASGWSAYSDKIYPQDGIYFADPEVGRVLHDNGLIADANKSSIEELATITSLNPGGRYNTSYFYDNKVITKFPELKYCTGLSDLRYTFNWCTNLTEVTIPDSVTDMNQTFNRCMSLVNAPTIPEGITSLYSTFSYCTSLVSAPDIPSSVTSLPWTFDGCVSLVNAPIIPISVTGMKNTFSTCTGLINAPSIPNNVSNMYGTFGHCVNLINAPTIPEGVTDIRYTFNWCKSLTTAPVLPEGVTNLTQTFYNCTSLLEAPDIPSSVTDLTWTFHSCSKLDGIFVIKPVNPPVYDWTFTTIKIVAIYVPDESVYTYKTAEGWSNHSDKIKPMSSKP